MLSTECKNYLTQNTQKRLNEPTINNKRANKIYKKKSERTIVHSDSTLKGGGYLLSRIALQYHRRKWA